MRRRFRFVRASTRVASALAQDAPLDSALGRRRPWLATSEARRAESSGRKGGTRTPTVLLPPAPQAKDSERGSKPRLEVSALSRLEE